MELCKHANYKVIDWILEPKYSNNTIKIRKDAVSGDTKHYLVKFSACKSMPDWFYLSYKDIKGGAVKTNGAIEVYEVSLDLKQDFTPIIKCSHEVF